jgi:hypothetical protein
MWNDPLDTVLNSPSIRFFAPFAEGPYFFLSSLPEMPISGSAPNSYTNIILLIDIGPLWRLFLGVVEEKQREAVYRMTSREAFTQRLPASGWWSFGGDITALSAKW